MYADNTKSLQLKDYNNTFVYSQYMTLHTPSQYRPPIGGYYGNVIDWKIFSELIEDDFRTPVYEYHTVLRYRNSAIWKKDRELILNELEWLQKKIFSILPLLHSRSTMNVLLKIGTSKIEHLDISEYYKAEMIEHSIACANIRYAIMEDFYYKKILKLPF